MSAGMPVLAAGWPMMCALYGGGEMMSVCARSCQKPQQHHPDVTAIVIHTTHITNSKMPLVTTPTSHAGTT